MNFQEKQQEYARLIVENGAAIQKGQELVLRCPAECWEFGRMIVKAGYEAGAKEVIVHWGDDEVARLRYEYAPMEVFENVPKWRADSMNSYAENGAAFIAITAENPNAFKGVDREKQMAAAKANDKAMEPYYKRMVSSQVQWVVAAVPGKEWAKQVFPEKSEAQAMESLWEAIFCAVRIQDGDAVQAWREHDALLSEKCEILNKYQFTELHYENEAGTDFRVGLVKNHIWEGGSEESGSGVRFIANMPTEEVFTMPDYRKAEGKVVSSRPLSYRGNLIKDFSLTFHEGKVVDFDAREGYDALKQLLDEKGKEFTSMQFSTYLEKKMHTVPKRLVFVVGGPYGFSEAVYKAASEKISLSKMTFSHQMIRLIFIEQIYRAMTILNNEPYHHE